MVVCSVESSRQRGENDRGGESRAVARLFFALWKRGGTDGETDWRGKVGRKERRTGRRCDEGTENVGVERRAAKTDTIGSFVSSSVSVTHTYAKLTYPSKKH